MRPTIAFALLATLLATTLPSHAGGDAAVVTVQENVVPGLIHQFSPQVIVIAAGESVTWDHPGNLPHSVTRTQQVGTSGPNNQPLAPGTSFSHVFASPGVYAYHCVPHMNQGMRGTVIVTP